MTSPERNNIAPEFANAGPPVIIVGMHRSGTSVVAGMLTICGLYLDPAIPPPEPGERLAVPTERLRADGYCEAVAFRLLNERLLERAGSAWDEPDRFLAVRDEPAFAHRNVDLVRRATYAQLSRDFMDQAPSWAAGWGWKDPRTSLTLAYWLRLFPTAKIVHVRRDPDAISRSLIKRAEAAPRRGAFVARIKRALTNPSSVTRAIERRIGLAPARTKAADANDRPFGHLIETYVNECERWRSLGEDRYLEVAFETVIGDPASAARRLGAFAGLGPDLERIEQAAAFVRPGR